MLTNMATSFLSPPEWRLAVVIFALLVVGCQRREEPSELSLPTFPQGSIELRVAYAVNPRLPRMTPAQLQILLQATRDTAREHFGLELRFSPTDEIPIEALFQKIPRKNERDVRKQIYDFKSGRGDPGRLARDFGQGFRQMGEPLAGMIEYVKPHVEIKEANYEALGAALAELQLQRIESWRTIRALDGGPIIDDSPYNEYMMWLALGYGEVPYELVLTNQILASVEHVYPSVHSAIRGGYSNGITTYSKSSRFGTFSIWSTFAFTAEDKWARQMRGGENYTFEEAAQLAGIGATHEIGHQLFHFMHPYGNDACVMNPVSLFAYRAWAEELSAEDCPIGSNPEMKPGAGKFHY
ncbi:MAG: hypothetical protein HY548_05245 [Elusimicrobia bacterium]|nr:hypothetical protein [Elusimicrobiota bacterium]